MNRCIIRWGKSCIMLCIDVSLAAFALAVPVLAADMAVKTPAPAVDPGEFRAFVEGGAFWTAAARFHIRCAGSKSLVRFPFSFGKRWKRQRQRKFATEGGLGRCSRRRLSLRRHSLARQYASALG